MKIFIIPMGGYGKRSSDLGDFKPLIDVNGKTILEHCISNLNYESDDRFILISAKPIFNRKYESKCESILQKLGIEKYEIVTLGNVAQGPALTVYKGLKNSVTHFTGEEEMHVVNVDQIVSYQQPKLNKNEGAMPIWFNNLGSSCYMKLNEQFDQIIDVKEKELISGYASSGVYIFGSLKLLFESIKWGIKNKDIWRTSKNYDYPELFLGPCFKYLLRNNYKVYPVSTYQKVDLGSTQSILKSKNNIL